MARGTDDAVNGHRTGITENERRILAMLASRGGTSSPEEMYVSDESFARLAKRGLVEAIGAGRYRITESGRNAAL
jgi:uncharacterized protein YjhX (UPF0386 family)